MIVDAKKMSLNKLIRPSRQCGKTNFQNSLMMAWLESYYTEEPVEINFEMIKVKIIQS